MGALNKILVAIPAYNEEIVLEKNCKELADYFATHYPDTQWQIIIADNYSGDNTPEIAKRLAAETDRIKYLYLNTKGKGLAIRESFRQNDANIYIFMDADLATDIHCIKNLIDEIENGNDIVIGSRYVQGSRVKRPLSRQLFSMAYKNLAHLLLNTKLSDLSCGFKAFNGKVVAEVLPLAQNKGFFWDAEVVCLAETLGYKIKEVPVDWSEFRNTKRKSTVKVLSTAIDYLSKIWGLRLRRAELSNTQKHNRSGHNNDADDLREP